MPDLDIKPAAPRPEPVKPAQSQAKPAQPVAPPTAPVAEQNIQYIMQEKSLNGLAGWLVFWMIVFALNGVTFITLFFGMIDAGIDDPANALTLVFAPILAISYLAATILIALRKKLAKWVSVGTFGLSALFMILLMIIDTQETGDMPLAMLVGTILATLVSSGLMAMYFLVSKRVAQTLIK